MEHVGTSRVDVSTSACLQLQGHRKGQSFSYADLSCSEVDVLLCPDVFLEMLISKLGYHWRQEDPRGPVSEMNSKTGRPVSPLCHDLGIKDDKGAPATPATPQET